MDDDNDEVPDYLFMDPFGLLRALVINSPGSHSQVALLALMDVLLGAEEDTQVASSELMEIMTHFLVNGPHDCDEELAEEQADIVSKFRKELGLDKDDKEEK